MKNKLTKKFSEKEIMDAMYVASIMKKTENETKSTNYNISNLLIPWYGTQEQFARKLLCEEIIRLRDLLKEVATYIEENEESEHERQFARDLKKHIEIT